MTDRTYDFDLHGFVGIRLLDADAADVAVVERQLGPLGAELDRAPDITIRFVDRAATAPLTYVGIGESGFDDDGFFLLRGKAGTPARTLLPFDRIGRTPEIVCERGVPAVPHLLTVVNLTALANGVLPLHASAFTVDGTGVLVTGWSKGGKTETLLGACLAGAAYVGDEWVYLTSQGRMYGVPEPIRLWAWQLDQLPELLAHRPPGDRLRLRSWQATATAAGRASTARWPGAGLVRRGVPILARQAYLQVPPAELFGPQAIRLEGTLDRVVLVLSHSGSETTVSTVEATEVAERMRASLAEERAAFLAHYRQFRFAFPHRRNALVEGAQAREVELLSAILTGRPAITVSHPYPCDVRALGRQVVAAATAVPADGHEAVSVP